jgi:flagellin-like hook-associated protein FlgL
MSLSAGVRNSLSSISDAASIAQQAQLRLSTGRKVNSAMDNAQSYFISEGLNNRASDLGTLLDGIGQGVKVLEAANKGIETITKLAQTAKGLTNSAKNATTQAERDSYAAQYTEVLKQINTIANDAGYNGSNLIKAGATAGTDDLTVNFNEDGSSKLTVAAKALDQVGLALTDVAAGDWADDADMSAAGAKSAGDKINDSAALIDTALKTLRTTAATFGANSTILSTRQDFTKGMINTLKSGADALVLADSNEEGANLLAAQTRGQLAQTALSLAAQADQAVLRLF